MNAISISMGADVIYLCCSGGELYNPEAPVSDWRWRLRPNKVESRGVWWSECLDWFGDDGGVEISDKVPQPTLVTLKSKGYFIPADWFEV